MRGGFRDASRGTAWTESPALATERHQLLMLAGIALDAQESVFEAPAFQVRLELFFDELGERGSIGSEPFEKPREVLVDEGVKGGLLRAVTFVRGCVAGQSQSRAGGHRSSAVIGVVLRMGSGSGAVIENSVPSGVGHSLAVHARGTRAPSMPAETRFRCSVMRRCEGARGRSAASCHSSMKPLFGIEPTVSLRSAVIAVGGMLLLSSNLVMVDDEVLQKWFDRHHNEWPGVRLHVLVRRVDPLYRRWWKTEGGTRHTRRGRTVRSRKGAHEPQREPVVDPLLGGRWSFCRPQPVCAD